MRACLPPVCKVWRLADTVEETVMVQRRGRRLQHCCVECTEQVDAPKTTRPSTASDIITSRVDSSLPLDTDGLGREREVGVAQPPFT